MEKGGEQVVTVEFSELHKILKDLTRRDILLYLKEKGPLPYVELMELTKVTNTGRFNYHLKVLGSLIEKQVDGKYYLTERGHLAVQLLSEFAEKAVQIYEQKKKSKKLAVTAILLMVGIIVVSSLLISMQLSQSNFNVTYWQQHPDLSSSPQNFLYLFNVTGTQENFRLATSDAINHALEPYISKYSIATKTAQDGSTYPSWSSGYIGKGQFTFTLSVQNELTSAQVDALTQDLKDALKSTQ